MMMDIVVVLVLVLVLVDVTTYYVLAHMVQTTLVEGVLMNGKPTFLHIVDSYTHSVLLWPLLKLLPSTVFPFQMVFSHRHFFRSITSK